MSARSCLGSVLLACLMLCTSAGGAPVLEEPLVPGRESTAAWADELERRLLSLAVPSLQAPGSVEQTSPRYASHEMDALDVTLFACGWLFDSPAPEDLALLEIAGALIAGRSESILSRQLVDRGLATEVDVRLSERSGRTSFALFVFGASLGRHTSFDDVVGAVITSLSASGPSAAELERVLRATSERARATRDDVRRIVMRYLQPQRRSVVELVPRNAPDPALSVKPRTESTQSTAARSTGRPSSLAPVSRQSNRKAPASLETVERGDTLIAIARRYKMSVSELARQNRIDPTRPIRVGQKLVVPHRAPRSSNPRARVGQTAKTQKPTAESLRNRPKPRSS